MKKNLTVSNNNYCFNSDFFNKAQKIQFSPTIEIILNFHYDLVMTQKDNDLSLWIYYRTEFWSNDTDKQNI